MSLYTIGELAKKCNVSVRTIQYYDERGILVPTDLTEALDASNNHVFYTLYSLNEKITDIKINNMNTIIYLKIDDGENQ